MPHLTMAQWLDVALVAQRLVSMVADSMDEPAATDSKGYRFWYRLLHQLSLNFWSAKRAS